MDTADTSTPAAVPIIDPDTFGRFEGLRETTLATFTDAKANATVRAFVDFVYTVCLEYSEHWPAGSFRHECHAAVADLRHLQGFLAMLNERTDGEERISAACGNLSARVKKIGDALEKLLTPQGEE
jgi:hypothetical protein